MSAKPTFSRRGVLLAGSALLAGCTVDTPDQGFWGAMQRFNDRAQARLFSPSRLARDPGAAAVTPMSAFPVYKIGDAIPALPAGWTLEVGGMVASPRRFTLEELQRLPRTEMRVRHHCVEGWSAVAGWHGVRLSDVAAAVGADPAAGFVEFVSFEPIPDAEVDEPDEADSKANPNAAATAPRAKTTYTSSWDRASALHPQTLLAYGMNGAPLGLPHGGPVRLYSANKLGYKMVKWLSGVRFLPQPTGGYWEDQGYEWYAGV